MKSRIPKITAALLILYLTLIALPAAGQAILTPTPDADGNIYYIIRSNDSCLSISLTMGIDIQTLRQLNNLDENCTLVANTRLLLGRYETPTPTPGPSPTPTPITPTPTPYLGYGQICILLFQDINGNAIYDETESPLPGGAVSLTKRTGTDNFTGITDAANALCFPEVPEGNYNISLAPPSDYNPTTNMNYPITVRAGDNTIVNFGAQKSAILEETELRTDTNTKNPILAAAGAVLLLAGLALILIFGVFRKNDQL